MQAPLYQYPPFATPPNTTVESITPEKWLPNCPDVVRRRVPAREGSFTISPPAVLTGAPTLPDRFKGNDPDVIRRKIERPPGLSVRPLEPSLYTSGAWVGQEQPPLRRAKRNPTGGVTQPVHALPNETVAFEWSRPTEPAPRRAKRNPTGGATNPPDQTNLDVSIAFLREPALPVRRTPGARPANETVAPPSDPATLTPPIAWARAAEVPVRRGSPAAPGGGSGPIPLAALPVLTAVFRTPTVPVRRKDRAAPGGMVAPAPLPDTVPAGLDWWAGPVVPGRRPARSLPGVLARVAEPSLAEVPALGWLQPSAQPRLFRPKPPAWLPVWWRAVWLPPPTGEVVYLVGRDRSIFELFPDLDE